MSDAPPPPPAPLPPPSSGPVALVPPRPPPPGPLVWLAFFFGPPVLLAVGCALLVLVNSRGRSPNGEELVGVTLGGVLAGLVLGVCGVAGLALATRFFTGLTGRIVGGILLGVALLVGAGAAAFAGCMCVLSSSRSL